MSSPLALRTARERLPWFLPLVVAALVAAIGWWADGVVRRALEVKLGGELDTVLNANVTALEIWMRTQKRLALGIADDPTLRTAAITQLTSSPAAGPRPSAAPFNGRPGGLGGPGGPGGGPGGTREFDRLVQQRMRTAGFFVSQLVTTNLTIVSGFGRGRSWAGVPVPEEHQAKFTELFASGEPVIITPFRPRRDNARGPGGGPPFGRDGREGRNFTPGGPRGTNAPVDRPPPSGAERPESAWRGGFPSGPGGPGDPDGFNGPGGPSGSGGEGGRGGPPPGEPGGESRTNRPGFGRPPAGGLMQVAAPIRDAEGVVRGAVAFLLNPELEFSRILSVARPGTSGETYAFDAEGLLLSQSRFDAQLKSLGLLQDRPEAGAALSLTLRDPGGNLLRGHPVPATNAVLPLIHIVAAAVQGGSGVDVLPTRDYRGVPVVGAWRWLPEHGFGVATQLNATEAFQPLRALRSVFLALVGLLAIAAAVALVVSHFNLVWRRKASEAELKLRTLGQYTLQEKIGEGGMGVVYRAHHALLRRDTAIKLLLPERADEATLRQFEQEVRLTCALTHPNTIQIYDFGRTPDGIFYYAMEFLRGLNLAELVGRHGSPPEERILHILLQVCDSLHEAHAAGLVHRDIKPANIFLCERGGVPDTVKVLDFGLVKCLQPDDPRSGPGAAAGRLSGTPNYLPPETIRDPDCIDPRGDLYAVGAVAYYLATASPLFPSQTVHDILDRQLTETPVPPRSRGARIGPELEAVILACLEKDPASRPASALELRRRLAACPGATAWTLERRLAWWNALDGPADPANPLPVPNEVPTTLIPDASPPVEATLVIDVGGRSA